MPDTFNESKTWLLRRPWAPRCGPPDWQPEEENPDQSGIAIESLGNWRPKPLRELRSCAPEFVNSPISAGLPDARTEDGDSSA